MSYDWVGNLRGPEGPAGEGGSGGGLNIIGPTFIPGATYANGFADPNAEPFYRPNPVFFPMTLPADMPVVQVSLNIYQAGGDMRLAFYTLDGATMTRVSPVAVFDVTSTGTKVADLVATLPAGTIWAGWTSSTQALPQCLYPKPTGFGPVLVKTSGALSWTPAPSGVGLRATGSTSLDETLVVTDAQGTAIPIINLKVADAEGVD